MKRKINVRKTITVLLSLLLVFSTMTYPVFAIKDDSNLVEPLAYEEYTKTQDFGMGDTGYVTCTIKVRYDLNSGNYTLRSANVAEHFSVTLPLYHLTGTITTNLSINGVIPSNGKVYVTFRYSNGLGNTWSKTLTMNS